MAQNENENFEDWLKEQNITKEKLKEVGNKKQNEQTQCSPDNGLSSNIGNEISQKLSTQNELLEKIYMNIKFFFWCFIISFFLTLLYFLMV